MLEGCERVRDAVALAISGKLLGVVLTPTAPRCICCLMALGESGQSCRCGWKCLDRVDVGLLDASELPTKLGELRAHHGAHQRLKRVEHVAISRGPDRADLDDLHMFGRKAIAFITGGLKIDDEDHS
jgi:hypothetical protein